MSTSTKKDLRQLFIYQVYTRNHTEEGTFQALEKDLDRIQSLGVDVVYLLPIHPIGQIQRKGTLGSPYSIQDYRAINPEHGSLEDFKSLLKAIHDRGMKCMIDVVYNHTSYDSVLLKEHPEYFYRNEKGEFANRVGDWWDITDFDYTKDKGLWEELISTLEYWSTLGVDGYRFDVASLLPLDFLKEMRQRVEQVNPDTIFLSESVHGGFTSFLRNQGFACLSESEIYQVFDMAYDYDIHPFYENYLKGTSPFKRYMEELDRQEQIYPENYIKMRNLENHDFGRFSDMVKLDIDKINNWTALNFFSKGSTMIFSGQEFCASKHPSLFDKDTISFDGPDISNLITKLASIVKTKVTSHGAYEITVLDKDVYLGEYKYEGQALTGIFNVGLEETSISVEVPDGTYMNLINGETITISNGSYKLDKTPVIFKREL